MKNIPLRETKNYEVFADGKDHVLIKVKDHSLTPSEAVIKKQEWEAIQSFPNYSLEGIFVSEFDVGTHQMPKVAVELESEFAGRQVYNIEHCHYHENNVEKGRRYGQLLTTNWNLSDFIKHAINAYIQTPEGAEEFEKL